MLTPTVLNMLMPLTASFVAKLCGVVMMTDPGLVSIRENKNDCAPCEEELVAYHPESLAG